MQLIINSMLDITLSISAGTFMILAQLLLIKDVYKRKIRPGLLSWMGWAMLMGTSLISQILSKGWNWSLTGLLLSTLGCFLIFSISYMLNNYLLRKTDWYFLILGSICLLIYITSKNPWITTGFAILADFIVGIPTILHAYKNPISQKTNAWTFGFISWCITLIICIGNSWLYVLFPIYLFLYNATMIFLTQRRILQTKN